MGASELLEVGSIFGSIVLAWFAVVGWKLVPALRGAPSGVGEEVGR